MEAAKRAINSGVSKKAADLVADGVAKEVQKEGRRALARNAMRAEQQRLFDAASGKALKQTLVLDSGAAVLQDIIAQQTYMEPAHRKSLAKHKQLSLLC